jgi:hypothetical protein
MLSGVPQGSTLGPLLLNIFINDLCASKFLRFADDLKIFHAIKSAEDRKFLQSDVDFVQKRCIKNYMKIIFKTNIYFTRKINRIHFNYFLVDVSMVRTDYVKYLGVMLDSKLYFHRHVDCLHSQALKLLGLIRSITNFLLGYSKICIEYASVVRNNLTLSDSNKLENIQIKFANLCSHQIIQPNCFCNYESMLNYLHFKKLYTRRQNLDA